MRQKRSMKKFVAALVTLSVAGAVAAPIAAEAHTKNKKRYHARSYPTEQSTRSRSTSDYQEAIADKLPFGTSRWWRQMDMEGRGGQGRPN
jgi:hypothetical protein